MAIPYLHSKLRHDQDLTATAMPAARPSSEAEPVGSSPAEGTEVLIDLKVPPLDISSDSAPEQRSRPAATAGSVPLPKNINLLRLLNDGAQLEDGRVLLTARQIRELPAEIRLVENVFGHIIGREHISTKNMLDHGLTGYGFGLSPTQQAAIRKTTE